MSELTVTLSPEMDAALQEIARHEGVPVQQIIRTSIKKELYRRTRAKTAFKPDERSVAPLRALLADDFAFAQGWSDLQRRLRTKGYTVEEAGGGIAVFRLDGTKVCKGSDLGCSYSKLVRRFGAPLAGHAHVAVARKALSP